MLLGFLALDYNPGVKSIVGAAIAILAMIAYTKVNVEEAEAKKLAEQARQRDKVCSAMHEELAVTAREVAEVPTDASAIKV